jgi:16S rRNA (cytidine1402-2'-O)-methyltransferase
LPPKSSARRSRLEELAGDPRTLIFYESSHRVAESLVDMRDVFGAEREAVLARELTKLFETVIGEPLAELAVRVAEDPNQQRGECVILVAGRGEDADAKLAEGQRVFAILREELPPAKAAKLAAAITGASRKSLYGDKGEG